MYLAKVSLVMPNRPVLGSWLIDTLTKSRAISRGKRAWLWAVTVLQVWLSSVNSFTCRSPSANWVRTAAGLLLCWSMSSTPFHAPVEVGEVGVARPADDEHPADAAHADHRLNARQRQE